ncbi:hypothetical protein FQN49_000331 [Arthroderma sp. PD_2]|nr:hypothetical protein FQN49_000331 [Arthroderma sp. PD_2]
MFSRNPSTNKGVRRSKSSASVQARRPATSATEAFDAELAQLQALAAASLAMRRHGKRPSSASSGAKGTCDESCSVDGGRRQHTFQSSRQESVLSGGTGSYSYSQAAPIAETVIYEERPPTPEETEGERRHGLKPGSANDGVVSPRPSSYRKLRKSKSMFSTHRLSSSNEQRNNNRSTSSGTSRLSRRTLRRSLSFFRGDSESNSAPENQAKPPSLPIELAREQFRKSVEQRRIATASEPAVGRRPRQDPKPFKKSMRSNGGNTGSTPSAHTSSDTYRGSKGRLFSFSIKNSLRRIFGRRLSGTDGESSEQLETQYRLDSGDAGSSEDSVYFEGSSDYANYRDQLSSRNAANAAPSVRSMKSCSSMATTNSRVTSWTDSTAGNTITMKQPPPIARQGLDIIREDSDAYTPTPSPGRHRHDGYSIFRQPRDNTVDIDSQRMFSALLRNIDETKNKEKGKPTSPLKQKAKSVREPSANCSPLTARVVKQSPDGSPAKFSKYPARGSPSACSQFSMRSSRTVRLTPQEIAQRNESVSKPQVEQTMHGPGSNGLLGIPGSRTEETNEALRCQDERLDIREDTGSVVINRSFGSPNQPMSPSVYSRTTDVMSPYQIQTDLDASDSEDEGGTVTIFNSHRLPYRPRAGSRRASQAIRGSADWKTWMSSQMDLIDAAARSTSLGKPSYAIPGHYREGAQIDDPGHQGGGDSLTQSKLALNELSSAQSWSQLKPEEDPAEPSSIPSSNFSRPLSCSPIGTLSACSTVVRKPSMNTSTIHRACTPMICNSEMTPSPLSIRARSVSRTPTSASISPLLYNKTRPAEATTAVLEDSPTARGSLSSRGRYGKSASPLCLSDSKQLLQEIQFNSVRPRREPMSVTKENKRGSSSYRQRERPNYASKLNGLHSTISTKRMVDIFLSERSQATGESAEDGAPEPAFL